MLEVRGRQQDVMVEEKGQPAQLLVRVAGKLQTNDRRPSSMTSTHPHHHAQTNTAFSLVVNEPPGLGIFVNVRVNAGIS